MAENSEGLILNIENGGYSISVDSVVNGGLEAMIRNGLKVMALCNDGTGRSHRVAQELTKRGIPAVSLGEGLKSLNRDHHLFPHLVTEINQVPFVGVILTAEEYHTYNGILQNLKASRYQNSDSAIESLAKMATGRG